MYCQCDWKINHLLCHWQSKLAQYWGKKNGLDLGVAYLFFLRVKLFDLALFLDTQRVCFFFAVVSLKGGFGRGGGSGVHTYNYICIRQGKQFLIIYKYHHNCWSESQCVHRKYLPQPGHLHTQTTIIVMHRVTSHSQSYFCIWTKCIHPSNPMRSIGKFILKWM